MIDCKEIVNDIKADLKDKIKQLELNRGVKPCLAIIQVGNNPDSNRYVKGKIEDCREVGIQTILYHFDDITTDQLLYLISELNMTDSVHGIIIQLPLLSHIDEQAVLEQIDETKDVDGFNPNSGFIPCTPKGILTLLNSLQVDLKGKTVTFVGYGKLVNKPLHSIISDSGATCVICRSHTDNDLMQTLCRLSDVIISAVGKHGLITKDCISSVKEQVIIDAGIQVIDKKQYGDCAEEVYDIVNNVTPRVNGVGLLTRASLLQNVFEAADKFGIRR